MNRFLSEEALQRNFYLGPLVLGIFSVLLFLPGLGARDLWAPGEPIYGEVIRVMHEKNDWLVPMLNGQIYADKPVLYFWLALIVSKLAGEVSEWTLRLPAALGGLALALATYQFGKTFYDRQTGLLSGLILATSSRVLWESRFLRLDTVLSFFLFLGFYFWLKAFTSKSSKNHYLLAYLCFALATLTKGPIGLALPGFAVLSLVLFSGRWREIRNMRLVAGFVLVIAVLAPWPWLLHLRGDDQWIKDFIWIHNVQNYALKPIGHVRPFYYYFVNLPPDFMPWTALVPGALIFYYPWKEKLRDPATLGLTCWFMAIFLFFSASKSKIAYYLLPLLPSLALFTGSYLRALFSPEYRSGFHWKWTVGVFYFLAFILGLAAVSIPIVAYKIEPGLFAWAVACALIFVGGAIGMFLFLRRKRIESVLVSLLAVLLGTFLVASIAVFPYLDRYKSPRSVGEFVKSNLPSDARVYVLNSTMADFNYYAQRETLPVVSSVGDLKKLTPPGQAAYLIADGKELKRFDPNAVFNIVTIQQIGEKKWYLLRIS